MGWEVAGKFKREVIYGHLWLIHVDIWQKRTQYCKANYPAININFKKNSTRWDRLFFKNTININTLFIKTSELKNRKYMLMLLFTFFLRETPGKGLANSHLLNKVHLQCSLLCEAFPGSPQPDRARSLVLSALLHPRE